MTYTTDVLIAGGGIIGASIAWRLAQQRLTVLLCDTGRLGGEASWAGAGMLVPGSEFDQPGEWRDFARHSLQLYPAFVSELEEASGVTIDFSRQGSLELVADEQAWDALQQRARTQAGLGFRGIEVSRKELFGRVPGIDQSLAGAILYPEEGQVDPRTVMAALRETLTRLGVRILENAKIESVHAEGRGRLANGDTIDAHRIVIAAGAWSSMLRVHGVQPIPEAFPVRGHLIGYHLAPDTLPHVLRYGHTYVVQRRSGFTIAGASEEQVGFNRSLDRGTAQQIATRAGELWRPLQGESYETWTGFRPGANNDGPLLGRWLHSRLWLAYGHYRNGILLAPATAERISAGLTSSLEKD